MVFQVLGVHIDIIEVRSAEVIDSFMQDVVDPSLEGGRCIRQSERHDKIFEESPMCSKGRHPFVAFPYPEEVVGPLEIDFREVFGFLETIQGGRDQWERVYVLLCDLIQPSVVHAK